MKARYLFMAFALFAAAVFLLYREDVTGGAKSDGAEERGTASRPHPRGASGADDDVREGRARSSRRRKAKPRIVTTDTGLQYEILQKGKGRRPGPTSKVEVHYVGTLEDGTVFDSSRERGEPAEFPLNAVIKGWTEGLQLMQPGGVYRFTIPPELAYGNGTGRGKFPANSTLIFEVELLGFEGE